MCNYTFCFCVCLSILLLPHHDMVCVYEVVIPVIITVPSNRTSVGIAVGSDSNIENCQLKQSIYHRGRQVLTSISSSQLTIAIVSSCEQDPITGADKKCRRWTWASTNQIDLLSHNHLSAKTIVCGVIAKLTELVSSAGDRTSIIKHYIAWLSSSCNVYNWIAYISSWCLDDFWKVYEVTSSIQTKLTLRKYFVRK